MFWGASPIVRKPFWPEKKRSFCMSGLNSPQGNPRIDLGCSLASPSGYFSHPTIVSICCFNPEESVCMSQQARNPSLKTDECRPHVGRPFVMGVTKEKSVLSTGACKARVYGARGKWSFWRLQSLSRYVQHFTRIAIAFASETIRKVGTSRRVSKTKRCEIPLSSPGPIWPMRLFRILDISRSLHPIPKT